MATILSRMLRGNAHQGSEERRYHNHLLALQKADIIPRNVDPMQNISPYEVVIFLQSINSS
ncbi:MAG: hypothetical protein LBP53_07565 [Candidatus Peribacteria bacterium]|nr:hypothetical protein [Candidatus Peribacteria bacterium]